MSTPKRYILFDINPNQQPTIINVANPDDLIYGSYKPKIALTKKKQPIAMEPTSNINLETLTNEELYKLIHNIKKNDISEKLEDVCSYCNKKGTLIEDSVLGCTICSECGTRGSEVIDMGAEWRVYEDGKGDNCNRCGDETNPLYNKSSGTMIVGGNAYISKINNWNLFSYPERTLKTSIEYIENKCVNNGIKKVIFDDAMLMWKKITEFKRTTGPREGKKYISRGNKRIGIMAACVYYACILRQVPRNKTEMRKIFGISKKHMSMGIKQYFSLMEENYRPATLRISSPEDFIPRHCEKLELNQKYIDQAIQIANNIKKIGFANDHTVSSIAAGSILLTIIENKLGINKKKLAKSFGISEVTISKIIKKILPYREILRNDEICDYVYNTIN